MDILCLQPHYVKTSMIENAEKAGKTFGVVSTEESVRAAINDLGYEVCTYGAPTHSRIASLLVPAWKYILGERQ